MTVYERLQTMKNNFENAANKSESMFFKQLWIKRTREVQKTMEELPIEVANQTYNKKHVVIRLIGEKA